MDIGIVGTGIYLPSMIESAADIAHQTKGVWSEQAIIEKLGIKQKTIPGHHDGTQEMGVKAARICLEKTGFDPLELDLILCVGEEWKEYPLTTSGIYIQEQIKATRAWAIDLQQRCCSTVAAMKIAKDMMIADDQINSVLIVGGYRNGDFLDYTDSSMSMMFNLAAGAGAIILKKNYGKNQLLGTHLITDGSMSRDAGVFYGGCQNPINPTNLDKAYKSLCLMDEEHMKQRLNEVSMNNWLLCLDQAFIKSNLQRKDLNFLAVIHFKRSMHHYLLDLLNLKDHQAPYLENYGHIGQFDPILSLEIGLESGAIKSGSVISMLAAGIGYAWAANVIKWG